MAKRKHFMPLGNNHTDILAKFNCQYQTKIIVSK